MPRRPAGWYSFDLNGWHIVALNSNADAALGSPQERWLRADLASASGHCVLAYFHLTWATSGFHGRTEALRPLVTDLLAAHTAVLLTGHDHHYERSAPIDLDNRIDPVGGMRVFVVGTGGAERYPALGASFTEAVNSGDWGLLGLDLAPGRFAWEFLPVAATGFHDSGSATCRAAP